MRNIQKQIKDALEKWPYGKLENLDNKILTEQTDRDGYRGLVVNVYRTAQYKDAIPLLINAPTWLLHQQELIEKLREEIITLKTTLKNPKE